MPGRRSRERLNETEETQKKARERKMKNERLGRGSIINYLIALAAIFSLNFVLPRLMPGDPLHAIYGDEALVAMTPEMEAYLIRQFALDKSWSEQLSAYLIGLLHGDLGLFLLLQRSGLHGHTGCPALDASPRCAGAGFSDGNGSRHGN